MRKLSKLTCALLITTGLSANAFAAGDTEKDQTPAAPAAAGADNQPDKPATPVVTPGATVISNGSKEEKKGASVDNMSNPTPAPGAKESGKP
jgi:hypothetical protein